VKKRHSSDIRTIWIGRLALHDHYAFIGVVLIALLMTPFVVLRTPMDIYPAIYIAVVRVPCPSDAERKADFGKRLHG